MSKTDLKSTIGKGAAFGVAGWAAENVLFGPRYSSAFKGAHVPFLPIYAIGGLALSYAIPKLESWSAIGRGATYAAIGTLTEFLGAQIDRELLHTQSWNYGQRDELARVTEGATDWGHAALWGALGLIAEKVGGR